MMLTSILIPFSPEYYKEFVAKNYFFDLSHGKNGFAKILAG